MRFPPYYPKALALHAVLVVALGLYFIFLRPALLPEDVRYLGARLPALLAVAPGFGQWLQKVFWVMGGYMLTVGWLTLYLAFTSFRGRAPGAFGVVAVAWLGSIAWMTVVNFMLASDFKWVLLLFSLPGAAALGLYLLKK